MKTFNEMTAEELLQTPFIPHTIGYILALRDKLKEAITPNPDEITIKWCVDDVIMLAGAKGYTVPTIDQAREVLILAKHYHDASVGISWDVLEVYLDVVLEEITDNS